MCPTAQEQYTFLILIERVYIISISLHCALEAVEQFNNYLLSP
jgi:hypothetical protein